MQTARRTSAGRAISSRRSRATSVGSISTTVLIQTAQTVRTAVGQRGRTLVVVLNHRLGFQLGKFQQHIADDVCFQAINVVQSRRTDRELDVHVLQHQLPNGRAFRGSRAVVLDCISKSCASISYFGAELIGRTISSHGARNVAQRVSQTQSNKHGIVSSTTTETVTTASQSRGFFHVRSVLSFVFKELQFFFHPTAIFVVGFQLVFNGTVRLNNNAFGGRFDDLGGLHCGNFSFQSSNLFGQLCFSGFDFSFSGFGHFCNLSHVSGFDSVQFFNDLRHFSTFDSLS